MVRASHRRRSLERRGVPRVAASHVQYLRSRAHLPRRRAPRAQGLRTQDRRIDRQLCDGSFSIARDVARHDGSAAPRRAARALGGHQVARAAVRRPADVRTARVESALQRERGPRVDARAARRGREVALSPAARRATKYRATRYRTSGNTISRIRGRDKESARRFQPDPR